ncbi:MAG: exodeoxyribonuclease VII large subunit, partial [Dongiaceae bacterium]
LRPKLLEDRIRQDRAALERWGQLLESLSYRNVLQRGFVLVRDAGDRPVTRAAAVSAGMRLRLGFADDTVPAIAEGGGAAAPAGQGAKRPAAKPRKDEGSGGGPQGSLL